MKSRIVERLAQHLLPHITKIELFLTESCTMRCDYCFVATKTAGRRMSWEVAQKSLDFLMAQSGSAPQVHITFFGGEPLLEFPLIRRIVAYAEQLAHELGKQVLYALTTNGTLITEEMLLFGQEHGLKYLLSIDGDKVSHDLHRKTRNGKGSWDMITGKNLRLLKSIQGWVGARMTVNPDTVDRLYQGFRTLFEIGVNQFIIAPNMDVAWTNEQKETYLVEMRKVADYYIEQKARGAPIRIADFEETLEQRISSYRNVWGCDAGRSRVAVSTSGDLYPCARFVNPFPNMIGRYHLGNVYKGITNISARLELLENRDEIRPACAACAVRDMCSGGCPAVNLHLNGSVFKECAMGCFTTGVTLDLLSRVASAESGATAHTYRNNVLSDVVSAS